MVSKNYPCIFFDNELSCWLLFNPPVDIIVADSKQDLRLVLDRIEARAQAQGLWAVGWLSYEAASGFDPLLTTRSDSEFPALWFGFFHAPTRHQQLPFQVNNIERDSWTASMSAQQYEEAFSQVRSLIARGDTYQVNLSFRLQAAACADPQQLFATMVAVQSGSYSAFIDAGRFVVCSAAPELLFARHGAELICNPMKGTERRGRYTREDRERYEGLLASMKDQAENVMIVDMVRNDLARVADRGSVHTSATCDVEVYPRVFQMTRKVFASASCSLGELMQVIYPAASITGAPKGRTMEIISQIESTPRRIYTGSIGFIDPDGRQVFNVAIRTALIDRERTSMEYGVGSGIVWDSQWRLEYDECFAKAGAVTANVESFELFETMLCDGQEGVFLTQRHIDRLRDSSAYFGRKLDEYRVRQELDRVAGVVHHIGRAQRVRLFVDKQGNVRVELSELPTLPSIYRVALACSPVVTEDPFLFHKTTVRRQYDLAVPEVADVDDVLLWNERGEITESRIANVVLDIDGSLFTPPIESGLLAGCYRAELLAAGVIKERVLFKADLYQARAVYLINSLRRMWSAILHRE